MECPECRVAHVPPGNRNDWVKNYALSNALEFIQKGPVGKLEKPYVFVKTKILILGIPFGIVKVAN